METSLDKSRDGTGFPSRVPNVDVANSGERFVIRSREPRSDFAKDVIVTTRAWHVSKEALPTSVNSPTPLRRNKNLVPPQNPAQENSCNSEYIDWNRWSQIWPHRSGIRRTPRPRIRIRRNPRNSAHSISLRRLLMRPLRSPRQKSSRANQAIGQSMTYAFLWAI